jgi:hypothetical protein
MLTIDTDVRMEKSDDDAMDVQPKPMAERPRPRPVAKNSQRQAKVPNVADSDQRDLATDKAGNKGSSTQKSNHIRKFLFFLNTVVLN